MSTPLPTTPSGVLLYVADHLDALPYDRVTRSDLVIGLRMATSDFDVRQAAFDALMAYQRGRGADGRWVVSYVHPIARTVAAAQLRAAATQAGLVTA